MIASDAEVASHREGPLRAATISRNPLPCFPTLRIFFFCNFLRDFRLFFRWKAVVDSVQFRVILNTTTKRFDAASWHAEMLRFGRRPTAADAASRNDPSREKATLENPQIFQSCKSKNFISAAIARVQRSRPPPAAETGRRGWGSGQQDARPAQGPRQTLGAATRPNANIKIIVPFNMPRAKRSNF